MNSGDSLLQRNLIPEPKILQVQVFHSSMVSWIPAECNGRHVVNVESVRGSERVAKFFKQVVEPNEFLTSMDTCNVFSFSSRECYHILKLASPTDCSSAHLHNICPS